jgi:hypothetical protein
LDADHGPRSRATIDPTVPARNTTPKPTAGRPVLKDRTGRYVVEIRDAAGVSLLLTSADWTESERTWRMVDTIAQRMGVTVGEVSAIADDCPIA